MTNVRKTNFRLIACLSAAAICAPAIAFAQDAQQGQAGAQEGEAESTGAITGTGSTTLGEGQPSEALPPPRSDDDPSPPPPAPTVASGGLTEQAGIGGDQAYGRAGVLELGGFANLTLATDYSAIGFSPTIGYFFMDNFQLSAIVNITHISLTTQNAAGNDEDQSSTQLMLLAEPSIHLPFTRSLYGFLGVGFGLASQSVDPGDSAGAGFAIAPRLGINVMVGRSGIFTPALQGVYQTTEAIQTPQGAVVAVKSSFGLQAGYTVMW